MIRKVTIENFMGHSKLECDNIPTINIIIGKNDTGKTGLLKLLYATVKTIETYNLKRHNDTVSFKQELSRKVLDTFMPTNRGIGDLVQKGKQRMRAEMSLENYQANYKQTLYYSFGDSTERNIIDCTGHVDEVPDGTLNALFIPAKEVLTAFNDILNVREHLYGRGFDDTYLDLIKALRIPTSRGRVSDGLYAVNKTLEELFEGKVQQTRNNSDQPFIFKKGNQQFRMHQTAEGIKKIGILTTLINNRQLTRGTVLFMDEPETTLHPSAVRKMVEMLIAMSGAGVQIFLASHSYFVIKQLALSAMREQVNVMCWCLERDDNHQITYNFKDLIDGVLPENTIIDEALAMYDEELSIDINA